MQRAEAEQAKTAPSTRGGGGFCRRPEGKPIGALAAVPLSQGDGISRACRGRTDARGVLTRQ